MLPVVVSDRADAKRQQIAVWYDDQKEDLGGRFLDALNRTLFQISKSPLVGRCFEVRGRPYDGERVRRTLFTGSWPYYTIYRIREHDIVVLVIHGSKEDEPEL
jgi:plasmid stabilization system protein ParE